MSKVMRCDKCGKEVRLDSYTHIYDYFVTCKIYIKSSRKGGTARDYHLCLDCAKKFFGIKKEKT